MEFESCFDIIGPVMIGPSSSHTAGAVSIGKFVYEWLGDCPDDATIILYSSFAQTYQGHGTDRALVGGLLGMTTQDVRIKHAFEVAKRENMKFSFDFGEQCPYFDHPNTTLITAKKGEHSVEVGGASIGGGLSKIYSINGEKTNIRLSTNEDLAAICRNVKEGGVRDEI